MHTPLHSTQVEPELDPKAKKPKPPKLPKGTDKRLYRNLNEVGGGCSLEGNVCWTTWPASHSAHALRE
jgi:hypothetical protein